MLLVKTVFMFTIFETLLFEGMSVLGPHNGLQRAGELNFSKKQKDVGFCWNWLKNDCLTTLGSFE